MGYAVGVVEAGRVTSFEDLPEPRRTLNYMLGSMERRIGVFAYFTLVLAFIIGFALRAVGLHWAVAWAIATLQAPVAVALPFLQTGRSGYILWAFAGATTLGLVLAGLGVALAHVFVRRRAA